MLFIPEDSSTEANSAAGTRQTMIIAVTVGVTVVLILVAVVVAIVIYRRRRYPLCYIYI